MQIFLLKRETSPSSRRLPWSVAHQLFSVTCLSVVEMGEGATHWKNPGSVVWQDPWCQMLLSPTAKAPPTWWLPVLTSRTPVATAHVDESILISGICIAPFLLSGFSDDRHCTHVKAEFLHHIKSWASVQFRLVCLLIMGMFKKVPKQSLLCLYIIAWFSQHAESEILF